MGILAYLAICIFWGLSSISIKFGLEGIEVFTFSYFRFLTTSMILVIYNLIKGKSFFIKKTDFKVIFLSATVMFFLNSMMIMFATQRLDAGIIPIVLSLVPVVMVLLESLLEKKLLVGPIGMIGILGGIAGIGIISMGAGAGAGAISIAGLGFLAAGILCWSSGSIYLRHKRIETSMTVLLMYQALTPLLYYAVIVYARGGPVLEWNPAAFGGVLYMAIADTIIGTACYVYLLKTWKMSIVATYAYINPIVGLFGAYFLLGESISMQKIAGMAVILFSVFLIQSDEKLRRKIVEIRKKRQKAINQ